MGEIVFLFLFLHEIKSTDKITKLTYIGNTVYQSVAQWQNTCLAYKRLLVQSTILQKE
jgi:hypothetical protein